MRALDHIEKWPWETEATFKKRRKSIYNRRYLEWNYTTYRGIKERYRKRNLHRWRRYNEKYRRGLKKRVAA